MGWAVLGAPALSCPATCGPVGHLTPEKVLNTCSQEIGSFKGACGCHRQTSLLQGLWLGSVSLDTTQSSEVHHPSSKAPPSLPCTPPRVSAGGLTLRSMLIRFSYHQEYFQRAVPSRGTGQDPGASLTDSLCLTWVTRGTAAMLSVAAFTSPPSVMHVPCSLESRQPHTVCQAPC